MDTLLLRGTEERQVKREMEIMNDYLSKYAEAITKMTEDHNARDRKFEEHIKGFSTGLQERNRKMDKKFEGMEKKIEDQKKNGWLGNKDQHNGKR